MSEERRAPVQGNRRLAVGAPGQARGTIAWWEHEKAWDGYARRFGRSQSAERIAERAGFDYAELVEFLGHEPTTWVAR